jgi:hypothetical protein
MKVDRSPAPKQNLSPVKSIPVNNSRPSILHPNWRKVTYAATTPYQSAGVSFVGAPEIVETSEIMKAMEQCGILTDKLDEVTQLLCELTFLGRKIESNRFEYLYNEEDQGKYQVMARKTTELRGVGKERFRINDAFHSYLEIVRSI